MGIRRDASPPPSELTVGRMVLVIVVCVTLFATAWGIVMVGFVVTLCFDPECSKSNKVLWVSIVASAILVLATGPVAWGIGGKRKLLLAAPLAFIPVSVALALAARLLRVGG